MRKVLTPERIAQLRRRPTLYRLARSGRFALGRALPLVVAPGIPGRIHPNDFMLAGNGAKAIEAYAQGGRQSAAEIIRYAGLAGQNAATAKAWLDFGCGYGRVLRFLTEQVDPSAVWVTDAIPAATEFCATELHVNAVSSLPARDDLRGFFDVIYAISVFTHLPLPACDALLAELHAALAPGGALIFSTHGESCLASPETYGPEFADHADEIREAFDRDGAVYRPYIYVKDASYGVTWHTEDYVRQMAERATDGGLSLVAMEPRGTEGHQDVYVFRRV